MRYVSLRCFKEERPQVRYRDMLTSKEASSPNFKENKTRFVAKRFNIIECNVLYRNKCAV